MDPTTELTGYILLGLVSISIYIIAAAIVAEMVYFIWWAMGSPQPSDLNPKHLSHTPGRLLNFYGKWLVRGYNAFEDKEDQRLMQMAMERAALSHPDPSTNGYAIELQNIFNDLNETDRRINWFKSLGGCIICFAPHLANLILLPVLTALHFGLYALPFWVWFLAYFFWWAIVLNFIHYKIQTRF